MLRDSSLTRYNKEAKGGERMTDKDQYYWYEIVSGTSASIRVEGYVKSSPSHIEDYLDERRAEGRLWGEGYRSHKANRIDSPPADWLRQEIAERETAIARLIEYLGELKEELSLQSRREDTEHA
jgi:hypothetical protein